MPQTMKETVSRQRIDQLRHPERDRARKAVHDAVKRGWLAPVSAKFCCDCGQPASEYDHFRGYAEEHQFSVQPVCKACHTIRGLNYDPKACEWCGKPYQPTGGRSKFCSNDCRRAELAQRKEDQKPLVTVPCLLCEQPFQTRIPQRQWCSRLCRDALRMRVRQATKRWDGRQLRGARVMAGLTQRAMGDLIGVKQSWVSQWERGIECPNEAHLRQLSELLEHPFRPIPEAATA